IAMPGRLRACIHHLVQHFIRNDYLYLYLGNEVDLVFAAAVGFGVPLLAAEAFDLGDRHASDSHFLKGILYGIQQVRPDDGIDLSHTASFTSFLILPPFLVSACTPRASGNSSAIADISVGSSF